MTPFLEDFIIYLTGLTFPFYLLPFKKSFLRIFFRYNLELSEKKCTFGKIFN